jgi:hypothetical protein
MSAPITITMQTAQIKRLLDAVDGDVKNLKKQLVTAVRATGRYTVSQMAKSVYDEINATQKVIKKSIKIKAEPTPERPRAVIEMKKEARIPLRDFKARQTAGKKATKKKAAVGGGVTYRIKRGGKAGFVAGGFQGPKPGAMNAKWKGRVFKRVGKARLPIVQLFGPSPWGVFVKKKKAEPISEEAERRLVNEIARRVRAINGRWIRPDNHKVKNATT